MNGREFKTLIYDGLSKLLKALGNPYRLEIIEMLAQGEKTVEQIVQLTGLSFANASQHLQVMKNNNLLKSKKDGRYVYYSIFNDELLALYQQIGKYAVREIAELERIMNRQREGNKAQDAVSLDDLEIMLANNNIVLLDVRPVNEYEAGHITGAVSLPTNEIIENLKNFSVEKEIIAYCRGPFCVLADEAVRLLNEQGYNVKRLDDGYPEWKLKQQTLNSNA